MTIVITGANRGIGAGLAAFYQEAGEEVVGAARSGGDVTLDVTNNALVIGRMRHDDAFTSFWIVMRLRKNAGAFGFGILEVLEQRGRIRDIKVPTRVFFFGLLENIAVH